MCMVREAGWSLDSFLSSGSMPITELSLKEGADRLPSKAPQCDVNGRWAQVVTWEEAKGATHSQGDSRCSQGDGRSERNWKHKWGNGF